MTATWPLIAALCLAGGAPEAPTCEPEGASPEAARSSSDQVPPGSDDEPGPSSFLRSFRGFLEVRPRVYLRERSGSRNDESALLRAEIELDLRIAETVSGFVRPRLFVDTMDGDVGRFEPLEAYVTLVGDRWDLRAGQFVENWGIADTFNPIDVVNRRNFTIDFLDPERLGEVGARLRALWAGSDVFGEPTLSLYALPLFQQAELPSNRHRFAFGTEALPFAAGSAFEPRGFDRGLYALRWQSTLTTAPVNADLQLLAARGPERFPDVVRVSAEELIPVYYGAMTIGGGLRAVPNEAVMGRFLASLTFKAEVAHKRHYAFDGAPAAPPDGYWSFVVGADRQLHDLVRDGDALTLTVELAREVGAGDAASRLRPFGSDVILRTLWEANDSGRTSLETGLLYDTDNGETLFEATFERQLRFLHEDTKIIGQVQLFDPPGTGETLFDLLPNNSSFALALRWDF